ncbi:hypothetical protein ANRL2_04607 [Anaerolineae bacterium]|nr:hypothetical protein ANRL2_04607 [Anaerolineae bacterium]
MARTRAVANESIWSSSLTRERHFSGGFETRNLGENLGAVIICRAMKRLSKMGTTLALMLVLLAAGCVRSEMDTPVGDVERLGSFRRAVDSLQQASSEEEGSHSKAWERIRRSNSPSEVELWLSYFEDPRLTELLQSIENPDGSPVEYTIGDALYHVFRRRFARPNQYILDEREPPFLRSKDAGREWGRRHGYDLDAMKAEYAREAPKYRK